MTGLRGNWKLHRMPQFKPWIHYRSLLFDIIRPWNSSMNRWLAHDPWWMPLRNHQNEFLAHRLIWILSKKKLHVWITASDGAALKLSAYDAVRTFSEKKAMPTCCTIDPFRCSSWPRRAWVVGRNKSFGIRLERERKTRIELQLPK